MRVVMVSDAHASGRDDPSQNSLVTWLDRLEADRLCLLGDVFHHWWGFDRVVWDPYVPLCDALRRVRLRGVDITFIPGNHDFAVGRYLREDVGVEVEGPHIRVIDGVRYLLAHGDEADRSLGYRMTSAVLRGRPFAVAMRVIGPERAHSVLRRLAGASREHMALDPRPLLEAQQAWARPRLGAQADVAVMGHIHVPAVVELDEGTVVHLGDWVEHRTWLEVVDGVPRLLQGLDGLPFVGG